MPVRKTRGHRSRKNGPSHGSSMRFSSCRLFRRCGLRCFCACCRAFCRRACGRGRRSGIGRFWCRRGDARLRRCGRGFRFRCCLGRCRSRGRWRGRRRLAGGVLSRSRFRRNLPADRSTCPDRRQRVLVYLKFNDAAFRVGRSCR